MIDRPRELPTAFHDLPAAAFPVTIEYFNAKRVLLRTMHIEGPGVMYVPPLSNLFGPVGVRIAFANGRSHEEPPPGGWTDV